MSQADRAKQFAPFAALKGYSEALRKKERIIIERAELSEDYKQELDYTFSMIKKNDIICVIFYDKDEYIKITGMVSKINLEEKFIQVVNTRILFKDIYKIENIKKS